jgi:16S rRNA (uracil1498-N3)-methyltransferase
MRRVLCPELPKPERPVVIPEAEATHLTRVLRLSVGDEIEVIDGRGGACTARLALRGKQWMATLSEVSPEKRTSKELEVVPVILEVAVLKGEAMEWVVEKAVELGARSLHPFISANTVL